MPARSARRRGHGLRCSRGPASRPVLRRWPPNTSRAGCCLSPWTGSTPYRLPCLHSPTDSHLFICERIGVVQIRGFLLAKHKIMLVLFEPTQAIFGDPISVQMFHIVFIPLLPFGAREHTFLDERCERERDGNPRVAEPLHVLTNCVGRNAVVWVIYILSHGD